MSIQEKLDKLPAYLYCDEESCEHSDYAKHFLNLNRDIRGKWSVGYVEFETHSAIYTENNFETIEQAVNALIEELRGSHNE